MDSKAVLDWKDHVSLPCLVPIIVGGIAWNRSGGRQPLETYYAHRWAQPTGSHSVIGPGLVAITNQVYVDPLLC